jgi:hypothetical protein
MKMNCRDGLDYCSRRLANAFCPAGKSELDLQTSGCRILSVPVNEDRRGTGKVGDGMINTDTPRIIFVTNEETDTHWEMYR